MSLRHPREDFIDMHPHFQAEMLFVIHKLIFRCNIMAPPWPWFLFSSFSTQRFDLISSLVTTAFLCVHGVHYVPLALAVWGNNGLDSCTGEKNPE